MDILKKTKRYYHVRISAYELELLQKAIKHDQDTKAKEAKQEEYAQWFFENHEEVTWQDEYSSWHSHWRRKDTKESVPTPDYLTILMRRSTSLLKARKEKEDAINDEGCANETWRNKK